MKESGIGRPAQLLARQTIKSEGAGTVPLGRPSEPSLVTVLTPKPAPTLLRSGHSSGSDKIYARENLL